MKRTMAQLGYIAGLMERRGQIKEINFSDRGLELNFSNWDTALHVNKILKGKIFKKASANYYRIVVYVCCTEAIGWFMTCYSITSPPTKDRLLHAIISWKARQVRGIKGRPAPCHPRRSYYAKGKCMMCYQRERNGTLITAPWPTDKERRRKIGEQ